MHKSWIAVSVSLFCAGAFAQGPLTYPGCNVSYKDGDFAVQTLVSWNATKNYGGTLDADLSEPVKLAVGADPQGNIEVYFVELRGNFKVYRASDKSVHVIAKVPVQSSPSAGNPEQGLMGVALDPKFNTNRWVYLYYSTPVSNGVVNGSYRISRFTLSQDRLSMSGEKVILSFPTQYKDCCHTGGGMQFDDLGDLWVSIGNNEGRGSDGYNEKDSVYSGEWGSSSTASLRGGVIRIHPKDDGSYTIPKGNFWEYWAGEWDKQGKTALAAEYRDPSKVKREIYVKGNRNPYGIAVDKVRRWVAVGDVGPDGTPNTPSGRPDQSNLGEDHDLYLHPAFAGWPYFAGNNRKNGPNWQTKDPTKPMNTSKWNKGVQELPPGQGPLWEENNGASFGSTFYRYDKNLKSTSKLPAYFHKHFIWGNWSSGSITVAKIDDNGKMVGAKTDVFNGIPKNGITDVQLGPDGAMYMVNYAGFFSRADETRIDRIYYKGTQCNVDVPWEKAGCAATDPSVTLNVPEACDGQTSVLARLPGTDAWRRNIAVTGGGQSLDIPEGIRHVDLYDLKGHKVFARDVGGPGPLSLPSALSQGVYQAVLTR